MRYLAPELVSALNGSAETGLRVRFLLELEFAVDTARFHSGLGTIMFQGVPWYGFGGFGGVSMIGQKGDGAASAIQFSLAGLPSVGEVWNLLTMAEQYCRQGGPAKFYVAFIDDAGAIIGEPAGLSCTLVDVPIIKDDPGSCTITISTEDPLIRQQVGEGLRNTHEDQLHEFPGDLGMEYVAQLQDRTL